MEALQSHSAVPSPPAHVAIIMDGNGRWAKSRGLPRTAGHKRGAEAVRATVRGAVELGISTLTLFGFSAENWKRPQGEVRDLMGLLRLYLRNEINELNKNGVRLKVVGERSRLDPDIIALIREAEAKTIGNSKLTLVLALNYGGRQELVLAAQALAAQAVAGTMKPEDIDEDLFARHLHTTGLSDPDLLIRTSGEKRVSNFLLWQCAYSEMVFLEVLWPDFSKDHLAQAIRDYHGRERRYGAIS